MKPTVGRYIIAATIVAMIALFGTTYSSNTPTSKPVHEMEATYPIYDNLQQLASKSSAIVRGNVVNVLPSYRVVPEGIALAELPAHKAESIGYMMTDVEIEVEHVLVGSPDLTNTRIIVSHLGGEDAKHKYVMKDEPLSEKGKGYILFLEQVQADRYVILGGAQGRYVIQNGKLANLGDDVRHLPVAEFLQGMDVAVLEQDFNQVARKHQPKPQQAEQNEELKVSKDMPSAQNKPNGPPSGR